MSDVDTKVRNALLDLADRAPVDPNIPPQLRRRLRRRRTANVALVGALGAAVVAGTVFGLAAAIRVRGNSLQRPAAGRTEPWPGLYPAATAQEGEKLQACVDAGSHGTCARYVNVQEVVRGYAIEHLGWPGVYFTDALIVAQANDSEPATVTIGQCSPIEGTYFPKGCVVADVTVERLLRRDATGVWFVIQAHESVSDPEGSAQQAPTEAQARTFVEDFMTVRMGVGGSPRALDFLSAAAKSQYDRGDGGLVLFGEGIAGNGYLFDHFEVRSVRAADANSYEVEVSMVVGKDPGESAEDWVESFFVGPGQDYKGDIQPLIIRGAVLTSRSSRSAP
jgi:hypothetical protein